MDTQLILPLSRAAAAGGALGALRRGDKRRRRLRRPRPPRPRRQAPPHPRPGLPRARTRMHARTCIHTHTHTHDPSQRSRSESAAQIRVGGADPSLRRRSESAAPTRRDSWGARPRPRRQAAAVVRNTADCSCTDPGGCTSARRHRPGAAGAAGRRQGGGPIGRQQAPGLGQQASTPLASSCSIGDQPLTQSVTSRRLNQRLAADSIRD